MTELAELFDQTFADAAGSDSFGEAADQAEIQTGFREANFVAGLMLQLIDDQVGHLPQALQQELLTLRTRLAA